MQSMLYGKLPSELRQTIFEIAVTGDGSVHVCTSKDLGPDFGLTYSICRHLHDTSCAHNACVRIDEDLVRNSCIQSIIPLLTTCRRIYADTIPTVYSRMRFVIENIDAFSIFTSITPRGHLRRVRRLNVALHRKALSPLASWKMHKPDQSSQPAQCAR